MAAGTSIPQTEDKSSAASTVEAGLVWHNVPEEAEDLLAKANLKEDKSRSISNGGQLNRLLIGDNLLSLHCLLKTHKAKVDLIYIDPPYNTGSNGFRYEDDRQLTTFSDGSAIPRDHPMRHSAWLSFMHRRLEKARQLMSPEATIFLSINEDEYAELKLLCDKVFGGSNYLTTFVVKVRHDDRILKGDKDFHETYEFLLMYRRSESFKTIKRTQDNSSIDKYVYEIEELTDKPSLLKMDGKRVEVFAPEQYAIHKGEPAADKLQKINIRGSLKEGNSSGRFHMAHLEALKDEFNVLYKVPEIGSDHLPHRYFLSRLNAERSNGSYFQGVPVNRPETKQVPFANLLDFEEEFNKVGFEGGVVFRNGKKPVDFLRFLLRIGTSKKDALVLDFFAGSGSTGHAVLEQNSIDQGQRRFILCTSNESKIADEVTYTRLKNVILGHQLKRTKKTVLFEQKLTPINVVDNSQIIEMREKFLFDSSEDGTDDIREEIKDGVYRIVRLTKKEETYRLGGSLTVETVEISK